ncbi:hypothetical protein GCM10011351_26650 [Paraliobacillus quinghaiensis]|uniref:Uncharacterized protein n=1 Tax=Paraliobacillus quinghaiensis TaxID=470815 RepID=A0A917TW92_9BACI|nr:hypothetical protein GCM10011351_26650 [Paraliobacillus quinghaiensis]
MCNVSVNDLDEGLNKQKEHVNTENDTDYNKFEVELVQPYRGDTISVIYQGNRQCIRFLLADSSETSHAYLCEQSYR